MKNYLILPFVFIISTTCLAQRIVEKDVETTNSKELLLDFQFATKIKINLWNESKVAVKVNVNINNNEDNDIYELNSRKAGNIIEFSSNNDKWKELHRNCCNGNCENCCCNFNSEIIYEVYMPGDLSLEINSISGSVELPEMDEQSDLFIKTISGDIDIRLAAQKNVDISASTISGEIYSNLEFNYLDGKQGLRQVVGRKLKGRLNNGGRNWSLDTISGNVYLRKS